MAAIAKPAKAEDYKDTVSPKDLSNPLTQAALADLDALSMKEADTKGKRDGLAIRDFKGNIVGYSKTIKTKVPGGGDSNPAEKDGVDSKFVWKDTATVTAEAEAAAAAGAAGAGAGAGAAVTP